MVDPKTPEEWQAAVDGAHFLLCVDAARQYGLITGGPTVHADRCVEILERGKLLGYEPKEIKEYLQV
jgi:hypothetical protein